MTLTTEAALKVSGLLVWTAMPSGNDRFIMTLEKSISLYRRSSREAAALHNLLSLGCSLGFCYSSAVVLTCFKHPSENYTLSRGRRFKNPPICLKLRTPFGWGLV